MIIIVNSLKNIGFKCVKKKSPKIVGCNLILGAWGCGVFKNAPVFVVRVFVIYDKSQDKKTLNVFIDQLGI